MLANMEKSAVATELEKVSFIPTSKNNPKECSNYLTIVLISHASKVMLKIFQARLQQYVNQELPDVQAEFRKGRGTRDQIANIHWIIEKAREFQKNIYFCFIDYAKAFDCVDHNKLWKILKEMGIPDHLTCLLRNLYVGQEATVRISNETTEWFQSGRSMTTFILSTCLFNFYVECVYMLGCCSRVRLFSTPRTAIYQAPLSRRFSRQNTGVVAMPMSKEYSQLRE